MEAVCYVAVFDTRLLFEDLGAGYSMASMPLLSHERYERRADLPNRIIAAVPARRRRVVNANTPSNRLRNVVRRSFP